MGGIRRVLAVGGELDLVPLGEDRVGAAVVHDGRVM
jgi:hypothetical protein